MNHCVPEFEMDDHYPIHPKKSSAMGDDEEIMELRWHNGQVVMHSQRSGKKPFPDDNLIQTQPQPPPPLPQPNLFMQEDEMASWLLNDAPYDFCSDLFISTASPCVNAPSISLPPAAATATATTPAPPTSVLPAQPMDHGQLMPAPKPPIPPSGKKLDNFGHLLRLSRRRADESGPSHSNRAANESTVVESNETPAARSLSIASEAIPHPAVGGGGAVASTSGAGGGNTACEMTVTLSPGGSSASASAEPPSQKPPPLPPPPGDRKRKAKGPDEADCQSEDVDIESADTKKRAQGSSSTKRSRAAEVHNLSERRRRDRINEKMRTLQELIPHSNKADKASMLDEAIEYLKNLQSQVQFMSMGCGMVPMMFPGVPPYMPHMGMGIGMGMGMEMGMNRPMMPFPNVLAGSPLSAQGATAHMGPRFPMPAFHMQHIDPSRGGVGPSHPADPLLNTLMMQNPNHPLLPNFGDPYQQYLQHLQLQQQQNQNQVIQQGTSKPSSSKGAEILESPKSG